MLILLRALTYATLFVAFFLVVVPQRILRGSDYKWSGSPRIADSAFSGNST